MSSEKRPELDETNQPSLKSDDSQPSAAPISSSSIELPQVPEQYELLEPLGDGGMGVVYKARQRFTRQLVAIKMLKDKTANDVALQRFQREALAACAFTHPNAVRVLDFGVANETPYLVMEYVQGETLDARLKKGGAFRPNDALPIFLNVSAVLSEAHSAGVVHRDLKPANIIMHQTDSGEVAKVLDFGIAKLIDSDLHALTKTGDVFGTPLYMSPEQLKGLDVDRRSDVYSLGAVMYECLAGEPPHKGETPYAIMYKRLSDPPVSLSELNKAIPGELERIIFKCLQLEPAKRYSSATELFNDLHRFDKSRGLFALLPGGGNVCALGKKFKKRSAYGKHLLIAGGAAAAFLALIAIPKVIGDFQLAERSTSLKKLQEKAEGFVRQEQYDDALNCYAEAKSLVDSYPPLNTKNLQLSLLAAMINCLDKEHNDYFAEVTYLNQYLQLSSAGDSANSHIDSTMEHDFQEKRIRLSDVLIRELDQRLRANNLDDSKKCYMAIRSMLEFAPTVATKRQVQGCMSDCSSIALETGKLELALESARLSVDICRDRGMVNEGAFAHFQLARLLQIANQENAAEAEFREALKLFGMSRIPPLNAQRLDNTSSIMQVFLNARSKDCDQAIAALLKDLGTCKDFQCQWYRSLAYRARAITREHDNDPKTASEFFDQSTALQLANPQFADSGKGILDEAYRFYSKYDPPKAKQLEQQFLAFKAKYKLEFNLPISREAVR